MDKDQQANFEKFHVMRAHAMLLVTIIDAGAVDDMLAQVDRTKAAMQDYIRLPKPQQKAA